MTVARLLPPWKGGDLTPLQQSVEAIILSESCTGASSESSTSCVDAVAGVSCGDTQSLTRSFTSDRDMSGIFVKDLVCSDDSVDAVEAMAAWSAETSRPQCQCLCSALLQVGTDRSNRI